jgi:hypothetical protein
MSEQPVEAGVATVDATEVYYELSGDGPWMVLAHGGEGTRIHWWQQVAVFRRHGRPLDGWAGRLRRGATAPRRVRRDGPSLLAGLRGEGAGAGLSVPGAEPAQPAPGRTFRAGHSGHAERADIFNEARRWTSATTDNQPKPPDACWLTPSNRIRSASTGSEMASVGSPHSLGAAQPQRCATRVRNSGGRRGGKEKCR